MTMQIEDNTLYVKKENHAFMTIDAEPSIRNEMVDYFSFLVPGYKFMPDYKNKIWDGKIYLYNSRGRRLYVGLFYYLKKFAESEGRNYKIVLIDNTRYGYPEQTQDVDFSFIQDLTITSRGKEISPYDYQIETAYHALTNKRRMIISPTASGKSLIIYLIIRWFLKNRTEKDSHNKVLIVVPTTSLVEQMYGDFADYSQKDPSFNAEKLIHRIYSGKEKRVRDKLKYKIKLDSGLILSLDQTDYVVLSNGKKILVKDLKGTEEISDKWLEKISK